MQTVLGDLRYPERVTPALTLGMHALACCGVRPPPSARIVCELLIELADDEKARGITFGGVNRPYVDVYMNASEDIVATELTTLPGGAADSTWMATPEIYGLVVFAFSAAVYHATKKHRLVCSSSCIAEGNSHWLGEAVKSNPEEFIDRAIHLRHAGWPCRPSHFRIWPTSLPDGWSAT